MPSRLRTVVALVALALAGCTAPNKAYCDADTPCADPNAPFCDLDGEHQSAKNRCIENPFGACAGASDCADPMAPLCAEGIGCTPCTYLDEPDDDGCALIGGSAFSCSADDGRCIECERSVDCPNRAPICEDGLCVSCEQASSNAACEERDPAFPRCSAEGTSAGLCIECSNNGECLDAERPICAPDGVCKGCLDHPDCTSGLCDRESGSCVSESLMAFIQPAGNDDPTCGTQQSPCKTVQYAFEVRRLDEPRLAWFRLGNGTYDFSSDKIRVEGGFAAFIGEGTFTTIVQQSFSGTAFSVSDGGEMVLENLSLLGGYDGARCSDEDSMLRVHRVNVEGADVAAVRSGIGCFLKVTRSILRNNFGWSIQASPPTFEVTNNLVISNQVGVNFPSTQPAAGLVQFNTIAYNFLPAPQSTVEGIPAAVTCFTPGTTLANNIVWGNTVDDNPVGAQVEGTCNWNYSNIMGGVSGGFGNIDADPLFVDSANGDFRLQPGSPSEDTADPNASISIDYDGQPRPQGSGPDMGAFEVPR